MPLQRKIQCRICARYFLALAHHVPSHGYTPSQYKRIFGVRKITAQATRLQIGKITVKRGWGTIAWTDERILRAIRRLARTGEPMAGSRVQARHPRLHGVAAGRYGSWMAATRAAGLDYDRIRLWRPQWTAETVLTDIRSRHQAGRDLSFAGVLRGDPLLFRGATSCFGGWRQAVDAAGIRYEDVRLYPYDPDRKAGESLELLREWLMKRGVVNGATALAERPDLYHLAHHWLGGWRATLERLGYGYPFRMGPKQRWTRETIAGEIRRRLAEGLSIRPKDVEREHPGFYQRARRRLGGTWADVLGAAGLDPEAYMMRSWTPERVLAAIRRRAERGLSLGYCDTLADDGGLTQAAKVHQGGWRKAVEAAGYRLPPRRFRKSKWSIAQMREALLEDHRAGLSLHMSDLRERRRDLYYALTGFYPGGRRGALRDLGLDADPDVAGRRAKWTREAIRTTILRRHADGRSMYMRDVLKELPRLIVALQKRHHMTWREAVADAGLDTNALLGWRTWTADEVLETLRVRLRRKQSVRHKDVVAEPEGQKLYQAARRYFGGWKEALHAAAGGEGG